MAWPSCLTRETSLSFSLSTTPRDGEEVSSRPDQVLDILIVSNSSVFYILFFRILPWHEGFLC